MKQHDLQGIEVNRSFISMLENGQRKLNKKMARYFAYKFNNRADEIGMDLNVDESYLLMSKEDEARKYCLDKLYEEISIDAINDVIDISNRHSLGDIEALSYLKRGNYYFAKSDYSKALISYVESLSKYSNISDKNHEAFLFNRLGLCKLNELYYSEALEFFNKAYSLTFANDDLITRKNTIYNISLCYRKLFKLDESISYINSYLNLCDKESEFTNYVYAKVIEANCYRDKKEFYNALDIYNCLIGCFNNANEPILAYVYENLGILYSDNNDYEKAIECIDISQNIRTATDISNLSKSLIEKAFILIKQKKDNEAILLINLGIDLAKKYNDKEYELKGYYLLAIIFERNDNIKELEETYIEIINMIKENRNDKEIFDVYRKLCLIYLKNNDTEKAIKLLEK